MENNNTQEFLLTLSTNQPLNDWIPGRPARIACRLTPYSRLNFLPPSCYLIRPLQ